MMAMMIFAIVSVSLSLPFMRGVNLTSNSQNTVNSNNLARSYMREVEAKWENQVSFDAQTLPAIDSSYTMNGKYNVTAVVTSLAKDTSGVYVVKRVTLTYTPVNIKASPVKIIADFNRPSI